jgi:hypothetical protein
MLPILLYNKEERGPAKLRGSVLFLTKCVGFEPFIKWDQLLDN